MKEGYVMLKKFSLKILVALFCFTLFSAVASAAVNFDTSLPGAANTAPKKKLALMFVNNSKTTYDAELDAMIGENFDRMLKTKYDVVTGTKYVELLNKAGIVDISTAERADIVNVVLGENVDYILYAELQPFIRKEKITFFTYGLEMTAVMPIKIIDVKKNVYLYNGKFTELAKDSSAIGGIGNKSVAIKAMANTLDKMDSVIAARLP
jgi:hypothetical protein